MMKRSDESPAARSALAGIVGKRCPRCRRGAVFSSMWVMNDRLPDVWTRLRPRRPGLLHRRDVRQLCHGDTPDRPVNLDRVLDSQNLVALPPGRCWPGSLCFPLIPWLWQYSRVIWMHFDQYFDPEETSTSSPG